MKNRAKHSIIIYINKEGTRKMHKMLIRLDEEKIRKDGLYTVEQIWEMIDEKSFLTGRFEKKTQENGGIMYVGNTRDPRYEDWMGLMGAFYASIRDKKWFARYVLQWILYTNEEETDCGDFDDEDLLERNLSLNSLYKAVR